MLSREAAEIDRDFVTALKTDRRATIQWSSSDPTTVFISEVPNPARNLALNPYSVVAHKRNGAFFIGEDDSSVRHQVGGT